MSSEGNSDGRMGFSDWLAERHPDVQLTTMQQAWSDAHERGEQVVWAGGSRSGRTFLMDLWTEYYHRNGS